MSGNEYVLKPPKEVERKSATNPNIAARVGAELAQRLRAFCKENRVTMESAMQVAIAEFLALREGGERSAAPGKEPKSESSSTGGPVR